jgi:hypothetical protein
MQNSNNLSKAHPIRFTYHQEKALNKLSIMGVNKSKFIRQAVQEKLIKDFRETIAEIERNRTKLPF